jgi:hypothetical protein
MTRAATPPSVGDATLEDVTVGERFARALAVKDFDTIASLLHPEVDFRGMTPGRFWEAHSPAEIIDGVLRLWFEDSDHIDRLLDVVAGRVVQRDWVRYRVAVTNPDGRFEVEQQIYYQSAHGVITYMRAMCSGYQPLDPVA